MIEHIQIYISPNAEWIDFKHEFWCLIFRVDCKISLPFSLFPYQNRAILCIVLHQKVTWPVCTLKWSRIYGIRTIRNRIQIKVVFKLKENAINFNAYHRSKWMVHYHNKFYVLQSLHHIQCKKSLTIFIILKGNPNYIKNIFFFFTNKILLYSWYLHLPFHLCIYLKKYLRLGNEFFFKHFRPQNLKKTKEKKLWWYPYINGHTLHHIQRSVEVKPDFV